MKAIEKMIHEHARAVKSGGIKPPDCDCPKCKGKPKTYKRHDSYPRIVKFVIDSFVQTVTTLLIRWKCPLCKKTFVSYPNFLLPYRQYVAANILGLSSAYLDQDYETYRSTTTHNGSAIGYADDENKIDERQFAHSTIWRWLSSLGTAARMLKPENKIIIAPNKYRSNNRMRILELAKAVLNSGMELHKILFPQWATALG
jgi:transposase